LLLTQAAGQVEEPLRFGPTPWGMLARSSSPGGVLLFLGHGKQLRRTVPLRRGESERAKGAVGPAGDVIQLILDYAKQETLGPLKGLLRFLIAGVVGSIALSAGALLILLGLLRALQTETGSTFSGDWSWAPYLVTGAAAIIVLLLSAWRIKKGPASKRNMTQKGGA
jgi:hypothetical protein